MSSFETKRIGTAKILSSGARRRKRRLPKNVKYALLAIALILGLFCFNYLQTNKRATAYQDFKTNMNSNNFTEALIQLESFDNVFSSKYSKFNAKNSKLLPTPEDRKKFIVGMIKALDNLKSARYYPALVSLKKIQKDLSRVTTGFGKNRSVFHQRYKKDLAILIKEFKIYKRKEIKTPYLIQNNERRIYQQSILSQDLANEFGALMGLAPNLPRNSSQSIKFYQEGVLKGLPQLKKLPDQIEDLLQLKEELSKAGGEVRIKGGANTPDLFLKKVQELRAKCSVFEVQITNLAKENQEMSKNLVSSKKEFLKDIKSVQQIFKDFIISYVTPKRDSRR